MLTSHHSVFLQAGCPSCHPTNSIKALKDDKMNVFVNKHGDVFQSSGCCPTRSEVQKSKLGENRVRIDSINDVY